jgi:nucleoside-diphosphate-sugar epimerase
MSRVLITGATGFIGRQCLPMLVEKGYEVHAVSQQPHPESSAPGVVWHRRDLLAPGSTAREIVARVRPQYLLHLAWYTVPGKFWEAQENTEWMRASLRLVQAFAGGGGKRVIAAGTCFEYGPSAGECIEDSTPTKPSALYGRCKSDVASNLGSWSEKDGLDYAWGRVFYPYGPHQHPLRLVAYAVRSLLCGETAFCSGGTQTLDFIHVKDVAAAFVSLLESKIQGAVNIGSGRPVVVQALLQEIGRQTGKAGLIQLGARDSSAQTDRLWANIQKLTTHSNWKPQFDLVGGIRDTIQWWRGQLEGNEHCPGVDTTY